MEKSELDFKNTLLHMFVRGGKGKCGRQKRIK